jgi:hypothetical protein
LEATGSHGLAMALDPQEVRMAARFEAVSADSGFDNSVNPWLMVPQGGTNSVRLVDAAGLTVSNTNPTAATFTETAAAGGVRLVQFTGRARGTTFLVVTSGAREVARLEVSVKTKKTVKLVFNYVKDNARHRTTTNPGDETAWVTAINGIMTPQANVEATSINARWVTVPRNLGRVVRWARGLRGVAAAQHEWDVVVALRDPAGDLNIFCVWEYEQDATPLRDDVDAGTLGGNTLVDDSVGQPRGETLAHELGHHLGLADASGAGSRGRLMSPAGRHITKTEANTMNP